MKNHGYSLRLPTEDEAETLALTALGSIASDESQMAAFLELTGIAPGDLRRRASDRETLAAVLQFLVQDETSLVAFAANNGLDPASFEPARMVLAGEAPAGVRRR